MKWAISILFAIGVIYVDAQDLIKCADKDFRAYMDDLVSKGNYCYDMDNRAGIKLMADSIIDAITQRKNAGNLHRMDSLEYIADWYKLMGSFYYEEGYYDATFYIKAENHYNQALSIYKKTSEFERDLDKGIIIHRELANLYYKQGNYLKALEQMKVAYDALQKAVDRQDIDENDADYLSLQTQMALCYARMGRYEDGLRLIDIVIGLYEEHNIRYSEALRKKAKILMLREENGGKEGTVEALKCYRQYFGLKKKDALTHFLGMNSEEREQYWMHIRPFVTDCYRLEDADAGFLYDVTLFAKGLLLQLDSAGGGRQNIHATWQMVQEKLQPDACAIEFVQYEKYGQQKMGALVLKGTGKPIFVKMPDPDSVLNYKIDVKGSYLTVDSLIRSVHGPDWDSRVPRNLLYSDSLGLNNYIWTSELIAATDNCQDLLFAPDGYTHQLAIEYLLPETIKNKSCHRLSSTRVLLSESKEQSYKKALVVGGVDYYVESAANVMGNDQIAYRYVYNNGKPTTFGILEKSDGEVKEIVKHRNSPEDTLLVGAYALEQSFRRMCGDYSMIHISSHGVFNAATIPQGTDLKQNLKDNTLSHSLIAFAGINSSLKNNRFDANFQDGILSAKEISSLNLSKTELVVLCCCETGLGYVTPDGVYGIQRGLKNAGAKAIICTLWDIDDEASSYFMIRFHQYLKENNDLYKAFYQARESMRREYDEPSYRDAFILIDAI